MTQEEKQLLLQDLCARLPYGVIVKVSKEDNGNIKSYNKSFDAEIYNLLLLNGGYAERGNIYHYSQFSLKPYLRPMSSMTEEEKNELRNILWFGYPSDDNDRYSHRGIEVKHCLYDDEKHSTYDFDDFRIFENFLLKNHLDYRGLIPMGLALEAPEDMYNTNTN